MAVGAPRSHGRFHETCSGAEFGEAVTRAGNQSKDLRYRVSKVEELGDEEEAKGFGEMALDADDGKDHAREVAICVADKYLCGIPVVVEECGGHAYPGEEEVEREQVRVGGRVRVGREQVQAVVEGDEGGDDKALGYLDAVYAGKHVDALRAEHGYASHVDVVQGTEVE